MDLNTDKPLWHYTMKELLTMQEKSMITTFTRIVEKAFNKANPPAEPEVDSINIEEACKLTGLKDKTIYSKVSRLELPVLTRGRPLMFSREELQLWMRLGKPTVSQLELMKKKL